MHLYWGLKSTDLWCLPLSLWTSFLLSQGLSVNLEPWCSQQAVQIQSSCFWSPWCCVIGMWIVMLGLLHECWDQTQIPMLILELYWQWYLCSPRVIISLKWMRAFKLLWEKGMKHFGKWRKVCLPVFPQENQRESLHEVSAPQLLGSVWFSPSQVIHLLTWL